MRPDFKVLLLATNTEKDPYPVYPLGVATIAGALERIPVAVQGLDLMFVQDRKAAICAAVAEFQPDLVGLAIRAVDNTSFVEPVTWLPAVAEVLAEVRAQTAAPVVLGGSGYSLFPELILKRLGADFGIAGEGEQTFVALVSQLADGRDPLPRPGLFRPLQGRVSGSMPQVFFDPGQWATPSLRAFPLAPYLKAGGMAGVQTKRGCPMHCSYCTYPIIEGTGLRLRPPDRVADEVESLIAEGADYFFFVDNNFNLPGDHALAICEQLIERKLGGPFTAFVTPHGFAPELAAKMAGAGFRSLEFGSESGAEATLTGLGKGHTAADIIACDRGSVEHGLVPAHYFLFGGPGETPETVQQTLELIDQLRGPVVAALGLRVYPGTGLHTRAVAEGVVAAADDLLEPSFYFSPQVDPEALLNTLAEFARQRRTFVLVGSEININRALIRRLRQRGCKGALWEYMPLAPGRP